MAAVLAVVTLAGVATTVLMPSALAAAIDAATQGRELTRALVMLAVLIGAATVLDVLDGLIGAYYGSSLTAQLRHRLVGRALALGVPSQQRFPAGDLLSRLTANAGTPASFLPLLLSAGSTLLVAAGAVVGLALIDWRLAVTFLLGVPPAIVLVRRFVAKASNPFVRYQELLVEIITRLLDALRGVRTIRASGTSQQEIDRILGPLPELHGTGRQIWVAQGQASWRLGLLDPDEGEVLLDGVPLSRIELAALRHTVTYAFERPALLGATVHDMISYARPEATRTEVEAAAAIAQADRFIRLLPQGYDTPLGKAPMSGGELQRLGLARADLVAWLHAGRIRALAPHLVLWSDPDYRAVFAVAEDAENVGDAAAGTTVVVAARHA